MPYTLMKGLGWLLAALLVGMIIGWLLRSVAATRQMRRLRAVRADHSELDRLRARNANLEPVVAERDRLAAQLEAQSAANQGGAGHTANLVSAVEPHVAHDPTELSVARAEIEAVADDDDSGQPSIEVSRDSAGNATVQSATADDAAAGSATAGTQTAGNEAGGSETSDDKTGGSQTPRSKTPRKTTESKTTESKTTDSKTAGSKTTDSKTAGNQTAGSKTAGDKTAGNQTAGSKTAGDKTAGDKSPGSSKKLGEEFAGTATAGNATRTDGVRAGDGAGLGSEPVPDAVSAGAVAQSEPVEFTELNLVAAAAVIGKKFKLDDLTVVEGIGPGISGLCRGIGIHTWADLAATEVSLLRTMLADAGPRFQIHDPNSWPEQAGLLATGDWEAFKTLTESLGGRSTE